MSGYVFHGWQPIETAPKDIPILLYRKNRPGMIGFEYVIAKWHHRYGWVHPSEMTEEIARPTHWMHIPAVAAEQRLVTAHDALVDVVRMLRDRLDEEEMGEQSGDHVAIWQAIHEAAREALALASPAAPADMEKQS